MLGTVTGGVVELNEYGRIVKRCWNEIPAHFPKVVLDAFVVMPTHVHGILAFSGLGAGEPCDGTEGVRKPCAGSLSTVVRSFKAAVTKEVNALRNTPGATVWQCSFYDRIVRNRKELERFRRYIANNPLKWSLDRENPDNW